MYDNISYKNYMIKVSVIIPIYNTSEYLRECLDSVINQTLREIEIILIDDGSADNSLEILNEYAKKDKRITIIKNSISKNAAHARNQGLEIARGEFLSFLDSDDWFELDMLETAYNTCKRNKTDIGAFNAETFDSYSKKIISKIRLPYFFRSRFNIENIKTSECREWLFNMFNPAAWNKLFRAEYIRENNIKFQEILAANDVAFVMQALFFSDSISYIDKYFVHYRQNQLNCLSSKREKMPMLCYEALKFTKDIIKNSNRFVHFYNSFFRFLLINIHSALRVTTQDEFYRVKNILLKNVDLFKIKNSNEIIEFNKLENFYYKRILDLEYNDFVEDNFIKSLYLFYYKRIIDFIMSLNLNKVAIWGAGQNGKAFLEVFGEEININYIIDNDNKKQGQAINNIKITSFEDIKDNVDVIIVTNERFYEDILKQVREYSKGIIVLNLDSYLKFEMFDV